MHFYTFTFIFFIIYFFVSFTYVVSPTQDPCKNHEGLWIDLINKFILSTSNTFRLHYKWLSSQLIIYCSLQHDSVVEPTVHMCPTKHYLRFSYRKIHFHVFNLELGNLYMIEKKMFRFTESSFSTSHDAGDI